jgi:hypothetical protein
MATTNAVLSSTPTAGMKRGRDDSDDGVDAEGSGAAVRFEKVSYHIEY